MFTYICSVGLHVNGQKLETQELTKHVSIWMFAASFSNNKRNMPFYSQLFIVPFSRRKEAIICLIRLFITLQDTKSTRKTSIKCSLRHIKWYFQERLANIICRNVLYLCIFTVAKKIGGFVYILFTQFLSFLSALFCSKFHM